MTDLTLKNGPLRFSALTAGFDQNPEGEIVVCLHGFPDDAHSFDTQLPALPEAGYRVVAPYLRGYEPSSQPDDGDYSISAIARAGERPHTSGDLALPMIPSASDAFSRRK